MSEQKISVILPIHELNEQTSALLTTAIDSVAKQVVRPDELVIVVPKGSDVEKYIKTYSFGDLANLVTVVENEGQTDFSRQVNLGISAAKGDWVSILEFDDEYSIHWFKNFKVYQESYQDVDVFMPIIVDVNVDNHFHGFTNEAVWANGFSDELGFLDKDALLTYQNFNIDGMVFRKSIVEDYGGFKSNIKLTFTYEFLLRMTQKDVKFMVIPRFGYKHVNEREGSLFKSYQSLDPIEAKWWLTMAKKEYFFTNDREITYEVDRA